MGFLNFLGVMSPAYTKLFTAMSGSTIVGEDSFGNVYHTAKPRKGYKRDRRWVMYAGAPEASAVPPEWHGWLHHQTDDVPGEATQSYRRPWQKPHKPNMTGTNQAYRPPGHILEGGKRDKAAGDYKAWKPNE